MRTRNVVLALAGAGAFVLKAERCRARPAPVPRACCRHPGAVTALGEIELKRCEKALATFMDRRRPPPHIRPQLDLGRRLTGHSIEIFEVRPDWMGGPPCCGSG
ncbi:MAG: DUF3024 domain-containing protein [Candidatus Krumholzibacteriia bacterium]